MSNQTPPPDSVDELIKQALFDYNLNTSLLGNAEDEELDVYVRFIQAHVDKKVNKVLGELNKEIFFSSANPDGQLVKNLILNKRRTIKKLRSEL